MYNAYMIRNDGKEIPVKVHPYGNPESIEETLYASQWLYKNTAHPEVKQSCLDLVKSFANQTLGIEGEFKESLLEWIDTFRYIVLTKDYLEEVGDLIESATIKDQDVLNQLICDELNQEFMRVRRGGMVNSFGDSKELVFRISSVKFNWFNIIYMFVHDHKREIDSVTIAKDEEATGYENYFYKHRGEVYNQMPVDEFLEQPGNPVVEGITTEQRRKLTEGKSIQESLSSTDENERHKVVSMIHRYEVTVEQYVRGNR